MIFHIGILGGGGSRVIVLFTEHLGPAHQKIPSSPIKGAGAGACCNVADGIEEYRRMSREARLGIHAWDESTSERARVMAARCAMALQPCNNTNRSYIGIVFVKSLSVSLCNVPC